jgi:hypothetical protein
VVEEKDTGFDMGLKYIRERINDTWGTRHWEGLQHGLLAAHVQPRFGGNPGSATGGHLIYETETASYRWSPPTPRSGMRIVVSFWRRSPQAPTERSLHNTDGLSAHGSHLSFITDIHMRFSLLVSREPLTGTCDYYLTMTTCTSTTYSRMVDPVVRDRMSGRNAGLTAASRAGSLHFSEHTSAIRGWIPT